MLKNKKKIFILMGPKGSGKSYIGRLIQRRLGIKFILIEKIFKRIQRERAVLNKSFLKEGYALVGQKINKTLENTDALVFESTGAFPFFKTLLSRLTRHRNVKLIYLDVPFGICLKRIKARSQRNHLAMSAETIRNVYQKNKKLKYKYDLYIKNYNLTDKEIIELFKNLLVT